MHCAEFDELLHERLDERVDPARDPALDAHAANCPRCAASLAACHSLLAAVACPSPRDVPSGFTFQVLSRWQSQRVRRARRRALAAVGVAAALMVAVVIPWGRGSFGPQDGPAMARPQPEVAPQKDTAAAAPMLAGDKPMPSPALVDEAAEAFRPLVDSTTQALRTSLASSSDVARPVEAGATQPAESQPGGFWDAELAANVEPVTQSAARSLTTLLRVLPGGGGH